jgi:hypothetical protein
VSSKYLAFATLALMPSCAKNTNDGGSDRPDAAPQVSTDGAAVPGSPPDAQLDSSSSHMGGGDPAVLFPLAVGQRWSYSFTNVGGGSLCAPGLHDQIVVSDDPEGGRSAFQLTNPCTGVIGTNAFSAPGGDQVDLYYAGGWETLVDPMLVEGHSWPYFTSSYHWEREASVSVPAGTFTDCWTAVQDVSYTAFITYCRGVGAVRNFSRDLNGDGWDAKLHSKNFD